MTLTAAASRTSGADPLAPHERIVDFVLAARFEALPREAVEAATIFLMDTMAVGVAGAC